jgi:exonuclease III
MSVLVVVWVRFVSMDPNPTVTCWNVRGLNNSAKRKAVKEFLDSVRPNIVCLQETKLEVVDAFLLMQCCGLSLDGFAYLPAEEKRGGIILAWDTTVLHIDHIQWDANFITGPVHPMAGVEWWIIVVYGPQGDELKTQFLADLVARRVVCLGPWMVLRDFNMILRASEKSNTNLNRNMMNRFRAFVDNNELKELYMHGRRFTWTNERDVPTLTKIDRVSVSVDWELARPDYLLQVLSMGVSDHAPFHLSANVQYWPKKMILVRDILDQA